MNALLAPLAALALAVAAPAGAVAHAAPLPTPDVHVRFDGCGPFFGPRLRVGTPRLRVEFGASCRPVHHHCWQTVCEREWVPPVFERCVVAYDPCGRPVFREVMVRAGYWTTVQYRVCGCGQRQRC